jgi:MFS family permease
MRAAVASVSAVIIAILFVQTANGLQTNLLSIRAGLEAFPYWTIGIVMACYYVGYSLAPLSSHAIIGRFGHVNTMWVGAVFAALAIVLHAALVTPVAWAGLRLLSGFALSSLYVGAESWIHDRVTNDKRGRVFSIYMVVQMIAMTVAQVLFSLGDPRSAGPYILAAGLFVIGALPVVFARRTAPHRAPPEPLNIRKLCLASPLGAIATVLSGVTWASIFTFGPLYAQKSGFNLTEVSLFMALAMIGGSLVQFPMGWLSDAMGRRLTIGLMSAGGVAASLFGLWANTAGELPKYVASLLVGGLIFPMYGISAAHTNDAIAPQSRVAAAAGLILLFGLGSIFGPLIIGGAVTGLGTGGYYLVLAIGSALSLAAAVATR